MYIFEIIIKKIMQKRQPLQEEAENLDVQDENEECEHFFLPIDSTADYLACNKCGFVVKNDKKPKPRNIFAR